MKFVSLKWCAMKDEYKSSYDILNYDEKASAIYFLNINNFFYQKKSSSPNNKAVWSINHHINLCFGQSEW